jgi:NNP family nitrate/nitrite transporter-like MFS transporter
MCLRYAFLSPRWRAVACGRRRVSDKFGGGRVTFWTFLGMIIAVFGVLQFLPSEASPVREPQGLLCAVLSNWRRQRIHFQMIPSISAARGAYV